jgi:dTDP-4-amino-4,6-dideoxygalactose transaminase
MIPFFDLKKVNAPYLKIFQEKLPAFFDKNWYILGQEVENFEKNFADYCGVKHAIGVGNGLDALVLIFKAYIHLGKLQKGDQVIVPAHTFIASVLAIKEAGLEPVFLEPNPNTFNIDLNEINNNFNNKIKGVLCVHLYGQIADVEELSQFCRTNHILFVEDAAQSHGANINGKKAGSFGDAAGFSFYPAKNLGALGDGGCITTSNDELAMTIKKIRNYGSEKKYVHEFMGVNSRLDELQALFLNIKLADLDAANVHRQKVATYYLNHIKHPDIILPEVEDINQHVFHLFVIKTKNRQALIAYLLSKGIETHIHYPIAPHKQLAFAAYENLHLPITEVLQHEVLSLPISSVLTIDEAQMVVEALNSWTI